MSTRGSTLPDQLLAIFNARSVKIGSAALVLSVTLIIAWISLSRPSLCGLLNDAQHIAAAHKLIGLSIVFIWSLGLFLTVLPLGTSTVFIAGFFLGPIAGVVQFASLVLSSAILFEFSKDKDDAQLKERLSAWPKLARWAELAQKHGLIYSVAIRIAPIVPSAGAALSSAYFHLIRRDFLLGTLLAGWIRPVGFAYLGSLGQFAPICGFGAGG